MSQPPLSSEPITLVISEVVDPDRLQEYEEWTRGINQEARRFAGFIGVEVIRPRDRVNLEYVVIVKFENYARFRDWMTSATYRSWIEKSRGLISMRKQQQQPAGIELWFTLPSDVRQFAQPPYYKKVILGTLAVYPLILLAEVLLSPIFKSLPPLLGLFLSVTFVSALLTYPVMPWLTKVLGFWLY